MGEARNVYARMVRDAWRALQTPILDERDFVTAVRETREERDAALALVEELREEVRCLEIRAAG